jgi:hypothetical protein
MRMQRNVAGAGWLRDYVRLDSSAERIAKSTMIATIGERSIMPMRGIRRRSGSSTGSVKESSARMIGPARLIGNQLRIERMKIAKISPEISLATR